MSITKNRIFIHLETEERAALQRMAELDTRPPAQVMRYLLKNEAERRGFLPTNNKIAAPVEGFNGDLVTA